MYFSAHPLVPKDKSQLEAFLSPNNPETFFLRLTLEKDGIGKSTDFFGAYSQDGELKGVLSHGSNVQLYATDLSSISGLLDAWRAVRKETERKIETFSGPSEQIDYLLSLMDVKKEELHESEQRFNLFSAPLEDVKFPKLRLANPSAKVDVRRAEKRDIQTLSLFRYGYYVEANGWPENAKTFEKAVAEITKRVEIDRDLFLLEVDGEPVSYCGANGALGCVKIGPVYTPRALRRRKYAQAVIVGALNILKVEGFTRTSLFAEEEFTKLYTDIAIKNKGSWGYKVLKAPRLVP